MWRKTKHNVAQNMRSSVWWYQNDWNFFCPLRRVQIHLRWREFVVGGCFFKLKINFKYELYVCMYVNRIHVVLASWIKWGVPAGAKNDIMNTYLYIIFYFSVLLFSPSAAVLAFFHVFHNSNFFLFFFSFVWISLYFFSI